MSGTKTANAKAADDRLISVNQAADYLGVNHFTVRAMIRDGRLPVTIPIPRWKLGLAQTRTIAWLADPDIISVSVSSDDVVRPLRPSA